MAETHSNKRVRVDSDESHTESPDSSEAKRFRADILDILDDVDASGDRDPAIEDLATVMKSLEEEISLSLTAPPPFPLSESDSSESQPDLGYLLEASDDELGLPPTSSSAENDKESVDVLRGETETAEFGQIWGFEDEIPSYDALGFGICAEGEKNEDEPVFFGGLFDYPDVVSGPSDFSELSWRPESLPAL
ncbi:uncharacterized protein LOC131237667 [Magnolia sinica]|uniref:uncharacterized protein LOC131237667 n=1 Tax=Magnolia sinica TaxID=86752 RepID=UPI002658C0CD|nr:uncharacterized protein LOC131237667 [Magnolia sinica]